MYFKTDGPLCVIKFDEWWEEPEKTCKKITCLNSVVRAIGLSLFR